MPIRIICPACEATYTVDDALRGKKIRCKKCEEVFAVQPREEDSPRSDRRVSPKPVPKPPARPPRDEEEDERPVRKPARPRDDADETPERRPPSRVRASKDEEAPRRRPLRDRDDEDERPIRKGKPEKQGMSTGFLLAIGGGGLAVVGLLVTGVVFAVMSSGGSNPTTVTTTTTPPPIPPNQVAANPNLGGGNPQNLAPKQEDPKTPPADLAAADLQRVKDSTVYLRVDLPGGGAAEGTGFFAVEPGVIVTNAHVLGMLTPDSVTPKSVTVKVHHGETKEFEFKGIVLGVDRTNDLAVLRADGATPPLPPPLKVEPSSRLIETQKVWVFGFPGGTDVGKNISVNATTISSLRKDASGAISRVQVAGGMHSGNSGGPVTDSRGVVAGVSVAIIRGTPLAFAIPAEFVTRVLSGGISDVQAGIPYASGGGRPSLPVRLRAIDPLRRIRSVKLDVWTGPAGAALPESGKEPQQKPGDGPRQQVATTTDGAAYTADIPLPALPPGHIYWSQPVVADASGATTWAAARPLEFDPANVVDRKAAQLEYKVPAASIDRTLHITSNSSVNFFMANKSATEKRILDGNVREVSAPAVAPDVGTKVILYLAPPQYTEVSITGRVAATPPQVRALTSRFSPSYVVNEKGSLQRYTRPRFDERTVDPTTRRPIAPDTREGIADLFENLCNTYEVTMIPMPNRLVQPRETWKARVPMLVTAGPKKKEIRPLNLICTYEGVRTVNGAQLGYVLLKGEVNGNEKSGKGNQVYGKVSGHALIDLDAGMLSYVKTTISFEVDSGKPGLRVMVSDDNVVERVAGNTHNIQIPQPAAPLAKRDVPAGWKDYFAPDDSFRVMMPDTAGPVLNGRQIETPKKGVPLSLIYTKVMGTAKRTPVYVASSALVTQLTPLGKTSAERIDWFRDFARGKYAATGEKAITQGKVVGKEFAIERPTGVSRYRVYMHLNRFYIAVVTGSKEQVESKDATTFLDSYLIPAAITGVTPKKDKEKGKDK